MGAVQLTILKDIIKKFPTFIHARKKLVNALIGYSSSNISSSEKIIARDIAKEFINYYPSYITEEERIYFKNIIGGDQEDGGGCRITENKFFI